MLEKLNSLDINLSEDRGVSPVIGVILMVAITVILSAVIGTFVLGLGDQVDQPSATAGVNSDQENYDSGGIGVNVQYTTAGNVDRVVVAHPDQSFSAADGVSAQRLENVGESVTIIDSAAQGGADAPATSNGDVIATGYAFEEGDEFTIYGVINQQQEIIRNYQVR